MNRFDGLATVEIDSPPRDVLTATSDTAHQLAREVPVFFAALADHMRSIRTDRRTNQE